MADFRAVATVCDTVIHLLDTTYDNAQFNGTNATFQVYTADEFASRPIQTGVSLFLYRIFPNGTHRTPSGRQAMDGSRSLTRLPVDLHFLLTVWAAEASMQNALAGWMMRTIEDQPLLAAGVLNSVTSGVFRPDETVEVTLTELTNEDLLRIWEVLGQNVYQLSVPYVARVLMLESQRPPREIPAEVQEREPTLAAVGDASVARARSVTS